MSDLHDLFTLANHTQGETRKVAEKLLISAIKKTEWFAVNNDLLGPLQAGRDALPDIPYVSRNGYEALLVAASDKITEDLYKIQALQKEIEKLRRGPPEHQ